MIFYNILMYIWNRINALNFRCLITKKRNLFFCRIFIVFLPKDLFFYTHSIKKSKEMQEKCSGHYFNEKVITKWPGKRKKKKERKLDDQRIWKTASCPNKSSSFSVCWRKRKSIYWLSNLRVESWTNAHKSQQNDNIVEPLRHQENPLVSFHFFWPNNYIVCSLLFSSSTILLSYTSLT